MMLHGVVLQAPGGPELVIIAMILLPLIVLTAIGVVLIRRLMNLPDPSKVNALEREVAELREEVESLTAAVDEAETGRTPEAGDAGSPGETGSKDVESGRTGGSGTDLP